MRLEGNKENGFSNPVLDLSKGSTGEKRKQLSSRVSSTEKKTVQWITISHFISMYFQVKHNPQIDESKLLLEGLKKEILTSQEINK